MDQRTEPIRQDIDAIRDSMTEKMEQIESKIKGTVEGTSESLRRAVDVKYQITQHPWTAFGIAVLAGYTLGSMGDDQPSYESRRGQEYRYYPTSDRERASYRSAQYPSYDRSNYEQSRQESSSPYRYEPGRSGQTGAASYRTASYDNRQQRSAEPGLVDQVMNQFGDEINVLKAAAVTSLIGLVRDTIRHSMPGLSREMERMQRQQGSSSGRQGSSSGTQSQSGEGNKQYWREAGDTGSGSSTTRQQNTGETETYNKGGTDITGGKGPSNTYYKTEDTTPPGTSFDKPLRHDDRVTGAESSTQSDVKSNPNYDFIPPASQGEPTGRP